MPQTTSSLTDLQKRLAAIESTLAVSRRQLSEAQQLSRIGSWEWDIVAGSVWWSDELFRIYALEPGALTPTYEAFLEHVHPADRESVDARNRRAFEDHQPFDDVKRVVRADGTEILMRTQGEVVCDEGGKPLRMIGVCEDVTADRTAADRATARGLAGRLGGADERLEQAETLIQVGEQERALAAIVEVRAELARMAEALRGT